MQQTIYMYKHLSIWIYVIQNTIICIYSEYKFDKLTDIVEILHLLLDAFDTAI